MKKLNMVMWLLFCFILNNNNRDDGPKTYIGRRPNDKFHPPLIVNSRIQIDDPFY